MSLKTRLERLERALKPAPANGLVLVPWGHWPATEEGVAAMVDANPAPFLFLPDQAPSVEAWEACA